MKNRFDSAQHECSPYSCLLYGVRARELQGAGSGASELTLAVNSGVEGDALSRPLATTKFSKAFTST